MKRIHHWLVVATIATLSLPLCHAAESAGVPLPGASVYQLPIQLTDQDGRAFRLPSLRGKPIVVSMFYNSCQFVCPMLIDTIRSTEDSLSTVQRTNLSVLLVTFDPTRDTVAVLKSISATRHLDTSNWTLARTDAASVRKLAAVLGIQYRLLENGDYNHSTALILLDSEGRILGRTNEIGSVDPEFLRLVLHALK